MTQDLPKIDKLPKWAQTYVEQLIRDNAHLTKSVRELSEPESIVNTDTVVKYYTNPSVKLPPGCAIEFTVGEDHIQVRVRDGKLKIMSINGRLLIEPQVSNVVNIWTHR